MSYGIIDVVKDLITGKLSFASRQTVIERRSICDQCEVQNKATKVCTACGCFIPSKVRLKRAACPMELW